MARRKGSPVTDLITLATRLPWWLSVVLAMVSYVVLSVVGPPEQSATPSLEEIGAVVSEQFAYTFAQIGRLVLPVIFAIGAIANLLRRFRNGKLANAYAQGKDPSSMNWREFEYLVEELFRRRGFTVSATRDGADGGVDLIARRDGELVLVQCKHWNARQVGVTVVRELNGIVAASDAHGGVIVSSGRFTDDAVRFARQAGIELIAGTALRQIAKDVDPAAQMGDDAATFEAPEACGTTTPHCPLCETDMVLRTARRGANAGQQFWGCGQFPRCRGTRAI